MDWKKYTPCFCSDMENLERPKEIPSDKFCYFSFSHFLCLVFFIHLIHFNFDLPVFSWAPMQSPVVCK